MGDEEMLGGAVVVVVVVAFKCVVAMVSARRLRIWSRGEQPTGKHRTALFWKVAQIFFAWKLWMRRVGECSC